MKLHEFITWAESRGWAKDKYGHLQKTINNKEYRFKLSATSVRYETKVHFDSGGNEWLRLRSSYLKDLSVNSDNKLLGLKL